jgi:hypothetical protein
MTGAAVRADEVSGTDTTMIVDSNMTDPFVCGSAPSCRRLRVTRVRCKAEVGLSMLSRRDVMKPPRTQGISRAIGEAVDRSWIVETIDVAGF